MFKARRLGAQIDSFKRDLTTLCLKPKQTVICANPNLAASILVQSSNSARSRLSAERKNLEMCNRIFVLPRIRANQTLISRDPINALLCLYEIVDGGVGQTIFVAIRGEAITIKSAQAVNCAEPQEAARIAYNAKDALMCQPIGGGEGAHRQAFRFDAEAPGNQKQKKQHAW